MHYVIGLLFIVFIIWLILKALALAFAMLSAWLGHPLIVVLTLVMSAATCGLVLSLYRSRGNRIMSDIVRIGPPAWRARPETYGVAWMTGLTLAIVLLGRMVAQ